MSPTPVIREGDAILWKGRRCYFVFRENNRMRIKNDPTGANLTDWNWWDVDPRDVEPLREVPDDKR